MPRKGHSEEQIVFALKQVENGAKALRSSPATGGEPGIMVITQNGEAKAILQDESTYEEILETLTLLKVLALGQRELDAGLVQPVGPAFKRIRSQQAQRE